VVNNNEAVPVARWLGGVLRPTMDMVQPMQLIRRFAWFAHKSFWRFAFTSQSIFLISVTGWTLTRPTDHQLTARCDCTAARLTAVKSTSVSAGTWHCS